MTASAKRKAAVYQAIQSRQETGQARVLTVRRMCELTSVSRAGFYRFSPEKKGKGDTALRDAMQRIALEFPGYGWRRMTAELKRRGWAVNHKRVYRLMGEDNLLCLRKRRFIVTSDSDHPFAKLKPTSVNQLWVADITYIRLQLEFVFLAVVLDAFSRPQERAYVRESKREYRHVQGRYR